MFPRLRTGTLRTVQANAHFRPYPVGEAVSDYDPYDRDRDAPECRRRQNFTGSVNASKAEFRNAISDLAWFNEKWPEAVKSLITGRYPMESYAEVLLGPARGKNVTIIAR